MFDHVDQMLTNVFGQMPGGSELHLTFVAPHRDYAPEELTLNLFLCDVRENRELRDGASIIRRTGNGYTRELPPLHVDCEFLVTAWAKRDETGITEEHKLLGQALLYLSRFPVIPLKYYQDTGLMKYLYKPDGKDHEDHFAPITMVAPARPDGDLGQFWTALGIPPRPSFRLTVTLAVQVDTEKKIVPPPKEFVVITTLPQTPIWTGFVIDVKGDPITGAILTIKGTQISATTDHSGRYEFLEVQTGQYTLAIHAKEFKESEKTVAFKSDAQVHPIVLVRSQ